MVKVINLAVGKELLIGRTLNTNAHWIGGRLYKMGSMLDSIITVTDSLDEISKGLDEALSRKPDFVIVVGGLGPTPDDMTLKGVARGLGRKLRFNEEAIALIKLYMEKVGRVFELTPARRKMATLPIGSVPLVNKAGTAPGVRLAVGTTVVYCLPGVPKEMRDIFRHFAEKEIRDKLGEMHTSRVTMKISGVYEASLAPHIGDALKMHPEAYIKSHPRGLEGGVPRIELDITVNSPKAKVAHSAYAEVTDFLVAKVAALGGQVYSRRDTER